MVGEVMSSGRARHRVLVYIAGPFRSDNGWQLRCRIHAAEQAAAAVVEMGAMPVTPHSIGANFDKTGTDELWLDGTLELMRRCDVVLVLPGYEKSQGTQQEIAEARRLGKPLCMPQWFASGPNLQALASVIDTLARAKANQEG